MSDHSVGPHQPPNPKPGDIWFNTTSNDFYVMDGHNRWITVDDEDLVTDIIMQDDSDDPNRAYDRAMGVL